MSRRSFPRIDPAALRDHADEARVDRVWERIENDLATRGGWRDASRARRSTLAYVAIAATFGAFAAGLWVGRSTARKPQPVEAIVAPAIDKSLVTVIAAGSQSRTETLEGGGRLTLSPGTTIEVERAAGGSSLTLSLLQGEASIDAADRKGLSVVAGDARINTQAGAVLSVRRNADDIDVNVSDGKVSLSSPNGTQELGKNERATGVPIHARVASAPVDAAPRRGIAAPLRRAAPSRPLAQKGVGEPQWLQRYHNDEEGALVLLRKQGINEAIDRARSATELMAIADIMRHKGRDPAAAVRAFRRVVDSFAGDQNAYSAANYLAEFYQNQGETTPSQKYRERASLQATMADAFYCNMIAEQPDKTRAAALGSEYLRKYPNGQCHERVREMLQADDAAPANEPPAAPANGAVPGPGPAPIPAPSFLPAPPSAPPQQ